MIRIFNSKDNAVKDLLSQRLTGLDLVLDKVRQVVEDIRAEGDAAVFRYTRMFDGVELDENTLRVAETEVRTAYAQVDNSFLAALRAARDNIRRFHEKQRRNSWIETDALGNITGQLWQPVARAGLYVPGGTAAYPSSVLMNTIPAAVAGVEEIAMATPPGKDGRISPYTLVAACEAGVTEIYRLGGAQAVAALAFGTASIKKVEKITGPGNIYVTAAKKMVYGQVDIDMLAGPSEVLVIADEQADPAWVAADLLAQAEHDPMASAVLLTPSGALADAVQSEVDRQLNLLPRKDTAAAAVDRYGGIILTADLEEAVAIANQFAPEHLELQVRDPWTWVGRIKNAGAIFIGSYTPEPVGDYYAGPNHILPTGGTARYYSPLGVEDFLKRTSLIGYSPAGLAAAAPSITRLAGVEGLDAHARAVEIRSKQPGTAQGRR